MFVLQYQFMVYRHQPQQRLTFGIVLTGSAVLGQHLAVPGGVVHSRHAHTTARAARDLPVCGGGQCAVLGEPDLHCAQPAVRGGSS